MSLALERPASAKLWELRAAWASGRRVALTLERADCTRVEGHVSSVAATGVAVVVRGLLVPLDRVLAVHLPSRLGDSTARGEGWHGAPGRVVRPGQTEFALH